MTFPDLKEKILIVDDNPSNVKILKERLDDYQLEVAESGEEALDIAPRFRPDLILLDIMMPGIDGYEVCRLIRFDETLRGTKIIMVSAKAMRHERLDGYAAGADDYIAKPFDGQELLAKVRVYLRLKSVESFNRELTEQVDRQTQELRVAKDRAEAANRAKDEFVSTMTHELRNPLTSIIGFTDILGIECDGPLTDKQRNSVRIIRESADHLSHLVTDIFDVVKLNRNVVALNVSSFPVQGFVDSTIDMIAGQAGNRDITIDTTIDPELQQVCGDHRRCRQILLNLLSNAIKYTPPGGTIRVTAETNASGACIAVIDSGIGIEPDKIADLCTEFYQVDRSRDAKLGGTGIGLALTRKLVELHGGVISIESTLGKGSSFAFTLPNRGAAPAAEIPDAIHTPVLPRSLSGRRVLIAENDPANRATLIELLRMSDIDIMTAENGQEAVELAKYRTPDLILLDLQMPVMDGYAAAGVLRTLEHVAHTPIIAVSGDADHDVVNRALNAGCSEHIAKPITLAKLNTLLDRYINEPAAVPCAV